MYGPGQPYLWHICRVGHNLTYTVYVRYFWQGNHQIYGHIRCIYGIFGREITKYMVIYGAYVRFWPTLGVLHYPQKSALQSMKHTQVRQWAQASLLCIVPCPLRFAGPSQLRDLKVETLGLCLLFKNRWQRIRDGYWPCLLCAGCLIC